MQIPQRQYFLALHCALTISIFALHVQAQTGNFVNIDCGLPEKSTYVDPKTDLKYESDVSYIDSGVSKPISATYKSDSVDQLLWYVRSFPEGTRNCYTLSSPVGKNTTFLIRTRFLYGDYDGMNQLPEFDLYLGISFWDTVKVKDASEVIDKEIIHVINTDNLYLCLVDKKDGVPFISAIELRKLSSNAYPTNPPTSLMTYFRYDLGSGAKEVVRYGDDSYDRLWKPYNNSPLWTTSNTYLPVDSNQQDENNDYSPGSTIMGTAIVPTDPSQPLNIISWVPDDPATNFYFYLHFAETQLLSYNQSRLFNIILNGEMYYQYERPKYLYTNTLYSRGPRSEVGFNFTLVKTENSTLPPLINAIEAYTTRDIIESQTVQGDVDALLKIKSTYGVKKIWQGDPCGPQSFVWDGIECNSDMNTSSIISLNLSSSGLTGSISSYISNLKSIQNLDLSHNNLTGEVPSFLTQLADLKVINLADNNLTGTIPQELLQKNRRSIIILRLEGNPNLCSSDSCQSNNDTSKNSNKYKATLIAVIVALGVAFIIATATAAFLFLYVSKRKKSEVAIVDQVERANLAKNHKQFTYSEVSRITSNFQIIIGKGGFGMVYLGYLDNTPVAVKMLSPSSIQGYRQFQVEAELLMRIHHKNLTSLVGYCDEHDNIGLIYEYMANGNLEKHLSERSPNTLGWEKRIQIASDAAQGLDYLHKGCRPLIIHRDVKTSNILLNENFQAKVGDFGLSRVFPIDSETHVTTTIAGTPGYLDPEYYKTNRLNEKSDVYGFGVVLLQIISGRPAIEKSPMKTHIASWVKNMISTGDITKIVDPRLSGHFDVNSAWKILELAMDCLPDESTKRPTMSQVVAELEHCIALVRLHNSDASNAEKSSMIFNSEPSVR